ncbi:hypothetical protein BDF20DRAFT_865517 [Mycotypha africana]|uniref:uncharacterized protein n=1 Tax=Mycotypha africana TaxID=64632 RepID=UPI0023018CC6|nr:uncharacterized protein BDF20DRAFT_865517 [Mycotypha africana]KAI8982194.1 hypothetical protein BDF20DRAFT_865517 [Mycotypha africana]
MGGGMPPRWYDLFLDLLTQAAIQKYMCDGCTGLEAIHEIFSYGYVEDEDEEDDCDDEDDDDDDDEEEDEDEEEEEEEEEENDIWNVKAADHHLLFPKTRTMYLFKLQVHKREKEFTHIKEGYTLEQHFQELEKLYPFIYFERNMCDFIQMLLEDMDTPALDKCDVPDVASPIRSPEDLPEPHFTTHIPPLYKYPEDGALLMPEIPDVFTEENDSVSTTTTSISSTAIIPPSTSSIDTMNYSNDRKRSPYIAQLSLFEDQHYQKHPRLQ